jgi:hypothetical protein
VLAKAFSYKRVFRTHGHSCPRAMLVILVVHLACTIQPGLATRFCAYRTQSPAVTSLFSTDAAADEVPHQLSSRGSPSSNDKGIYSRQLPIHDSLRSQEQLQAVLASLAQICSFLGRSAAYARTAIQAASLRQALFMFYVGQAYKLQRRLSQEDSCRDSTMLYMLARAFQRQWDTIVVFNSADIDSLHSIQQQLAELLHVPPLSPHDCLNLLEALVAFASRCMVDDGGANIRAPGTQGKPRSQAGELPAVARDRAAAAGEAGGEAGGLQAELRAERQRQVEQELQELQAELALEQQYQQEEEQQRQLERAALSKVRHLYICRPPPHGRWGRQHAGAPAQHTIRQRPHAVHSPHASCLPAPPCGAQHAHLSQAIAARELEISEFDLRIKVAALGLVWPVTILQLLAKLISIADEPAHVQHLQAIG